MTASEVWAVIVAAGRGERFGGPKQYEELGGRRLLDWSVGTARPHCTGLVLVATPETVAAGGGEEPGIHAVVSGGATRSESVRAGLAVVPDHAGIVVVHDAARPLASAALFERVIAAVREGADAAVPAVPVSDTVKRVEGGRVIETLDRSNLVTVQTPQAFRAAALRRAHASGGEATDDAALVERAGGTVVAVAGEAGNIKVTRPEDLERVRGLLP